MSQVVPNVARFECKYKTGDNVVMNVYYVKTSDLTWSEASLDDVEAAIVDWETTTAVPLRNDQVALFEIIATDLTSLAGIRKAYGVSPAVPGALADPIPMNATLAIKADIGRRGRGTAGRTYWIGLAQGQLTVPDQIAPVASGQLVAAMNTLRDAIAAITPVEGMCVPHFVVGGEHPPIVSADIIVRYLLSDFYIDSQRDRLPNHKKHLKKKTAPPVP